MASRMCSRAAAELLFGRRGGLGRVELVVEFAAVILEFDELGAEFADPGPALGFR